ncbi:hydrogenase expression/formation protein HypE [Roseospira marina]|uniref:Hydrogenase expression/formation protein HypE n=1 Tax=Roseospira marina TaxID=140057 RepID=A0A5M6IES7_9PROT|nr:hydrogenase expression/formation protein HypE [Roseospira marina]KAA5606269.1 hydrogenase expression/formation protein HypE [Roseospira marina]MBB4314426.1 hydrogenase expression/formation protein HypE [Roseospira marina]MBB5087586.1 hydrogenase expression/formation protein HypE [Roseospira marina]
MNSPVRPFPPLDHTHGLVEMVHGAGGRAMTQLVREIFVTAFDTPALRRGDDTARVPIPPGRLVLTTDSYVITPRIFPGGDIGSMAVHGTVNDVAMSGAQPLYLSAGFILEEGLPLSELAWIAGTMARAAHEAGVAIVTGDTKVVERGGCDGLFITTTGVGVLTDDRVDIAGDRARPGDAILISGTLGDHGIAVMSQRENLSFDTPILSDSAALNGLVERMVAAVPDIHVLRDPTRGGLAATLNELADQSGVGMVVRETALPVRPEVRGACELLGLDPLSVANEGKLIAIVPAEHTDTLLAVMRDHPRGHHAALIGEVIADPDHIVQLETALGGRRIIDWLAGDPLPRIC